MLSEGVYQLKAKASIGQMIAQTQVIGIIPKTSCLKARAPRRMMATGTILAGIISCVYLLTN